MWVGWKRWMGGKYRRFFVHLWFSSNCKVSFLQYYRAGGVGSSWNPAWGTFAKYANGGYTAVTACCACGGGAKTLPPAPTESCTGAHCFTPERRCCQFVTEPVNLFEGEPLKASSVQPVSRRNPEVPHASQHAVVNSN